MKKVLFIMMLGLMFGQTKLETRVYEINNYTTTLWADLPANNRLINFNELAGFNIEYALIAIIEKLKGSKISAKTLVRIQQFGMFVLLGLFVLILLKDLKII